MSKWFFKIGLVKTRDALDIPKPACASSNQWEATCSTRVPPSSTALVWQLFRAGKKQQGKCGLTWNNTSASKKSIAFPAAAKRQLVIYSEGSSSPVVATDRWSSVHQTHAQSAFFSLFQPAQLIPGLWPFRIGALGCADKSR